MKIGKDRCNDKPSGFHLQSIWVCCNCRRTARTWRWWSRPVTQLDLWHQKYPTWPRNPGTFHPLDVSFGASSTRWNVGNFFLMISSISWTRVKIHSRQLGRSSPDMRPFYPCSICSRRKAYTQWSAHRCCWNDYLNNLAFVGSYMTLCWTHWFLVFSTKLMISSSFNPRITTQFTWVTTKLIFLGILSKIS